MGEGGFLTTGCCFCYCFLEIFVGGQGLDGERQSHDGGITPVPPLEKTLTFASYELLSFVTLEANLYTIHDVCDLYMSV